MVTLPNSLQLKKKSFPATSFVYKKSLMLKNYKPTQIQSSTIEELVICV